MINRVVLVGRLTRDSDLRYTRNGKAVTSFTVAVNRQFTNSQGEREADFVNCVIWGKPAENFNKFTSKGSLVGIDGRVQTSSYQDQQGNRKYRTDVITENFSLLESRREAEERDSNRQTNGGNGNPISPKPQNSEIDKSNGGSISSKQQNDEMGDPFRNNSKPIDISDDDLPF